MEILCIILLLIIAICIAIIINLIMQINKLKIWKKNAAKCISDFNLFYDEVAHAKQLIDIELIDDGYLCLEHALKMWGET